MKPSSGSRGCLGGGGTAITIAAAALLLSGCGGGGNITGDASRDGGQGPDAARTDVAADLFASDVAASDLVGGDTGQSDRPVSAPEGLLATEQRLFPVRNDAQLDVLFVIDDSPGMAALQAKLALRMPDFIAALAAGVGGLPDLHLAVVSSSLGAGKFGNVPGCIPGTAGNRDGLFQNPPTCTQVQPAQAFLSSAPNGTGRTTNFEGDLGAAAACLTRLGEGGCGFEHPFEAARLALTRSLTAGDWNGGFLRPEAHLAVVIFTNEDDCSVPVDSDLFDPAQQSLADPYGGLQSYRCNEFGHRCNGVSPPHAPPDNGFPVVFSDCASAEDGKLVTVDSFVQFLRSLKPNQDRVLVAAMAGPQAPYRVEGRDFTLSTGVTQRQPAVAHSCSTSATEFGDPAIRIKEWADAFGLSGIFESICADDFTPAIVNIGRTISRKLGKRCIEGRVLRRPDQAPDCVVSEQTRNAAGEPLSTAVPVCASPRSVTPCWELLGSSSVNCFPGGTELRFCRTAACDQGTPFPGAGDLLVTCSISPPGP